MEDPTTPEVNERRAERERRIDEACDVIAETLRQMWRRKRRAELAGQPWPPPEPPKPEPIRSPGVLHLESLGPPRRAFRRPEQRDNRVLRKLLEETWFPPLSLYAEPLVGQRKRVVMEYGEVTVGVGVLDEYGDAAVLRAIAVRPTFRRRGHARALAEHLIRMAYADGVGRVYATAASPWFVEEIGFEFRERGALPDDIQRLEGIIDAPPTAFVFELTPKRNGHRAPRRMFPRSAIELLTQGPGPRAARTSGPPAGRKRQRGSHAPR